MSAFFEATRDEYYRQLYNISSKGTWHDWFLYFLNGIAGQSLDVLSRAERINTLIINWQIKLDSSDGIAHTFLILHSYNKNCQRKYNMINYIVGRMGKLYPKQMPFYGRRTPAKSRSLLQDFPMAIFEDNFQPCLSFINP